MIKLIEAAMHYGISIEFDPNYHGAPAKCLAVKLRRKDYDYVHVLDEEQFRTICFDTESRESFINFIERKMEYISENIKEKKNDL